MVYFTITIGVCYENILWNVMETTSILKTGPSVVRIQGGSMLRAALVAEPRSD